MLSKQVNKNASYIAAHEAYVLAVFINIVNSWTFRGKGDPLSATNAKHVEQGSPFLFPSESSVGEKTSFGRTIATSLVWPLASASCSRSSESKGN